MISGIKHHAAVLLAICSMLSYWPACYNNITPQIPLISCTSCTTNEYRTFLHKLH